MTEQSKLSHHRFPQSVLSMLDHRHHRPCLAPRCDPGACSPRPRRREPPQLCSDRHHRARMRPGRCALLWHGCGPAVGMPWSSGAAQLPSVTARALLHLHCWAAAAKAMDVMASWLWAMPGPAVGCRGGAPVVLWARGPRLWPPASRGGDRPSLSRPVLLLCSIEKKKERVRN
jgi:hypothetical protein